MSNSSPGAIRLLHVDDEADFAETAGAFLEREDGRITVETAEDADVALSRLAETAVDCVVSDFDMPAGTASSSCESFARRYPDLPFILFTGKGSEEVASEAISAGVTDYPPEGGRHRPVRHPREPHRERGRAAARRTGPQTTPRSHRNRPGGISILDADGRFIYVNDAYAALYRYDREAMLGEHWSMLYPDEGPRSGRDRRYSRPSGRPATGAARRPVSAPTGARSSRTTLATTEHGELVCSVQDRSDRKARKQAIEALHSTARSFIQAGSVEEVAEIAVDAVRDIPRHPGERDPPLRRRRRRAGAGGLDRPHRGTRRRTPDVRTRRGTGVGDVRERRASGLHRRHDRIGSIQPEDAGTEPDRPPLDDHGVHVIVSPDPDAFDGRTSRSLLERSRPTRRRPSTASSESANSPSRTTGWRRSPAS